MTLPNSGSTFTNRVRALRLKLNPGQFFSRRTAAMLHGLPVQNARAPDTVELGAVRPQRPLRRPEVTGHQLREGALERLPSAPAWLPTVEDTWCLLAQTASLNELLAAGDFLVSGASRHEEPLSTVAALAVAVERFRGCAGARLRERVLPLIRSGVESPAESRLRILMVTHGLPEPRTSCPVPVPGRVLRADLGYEKLKIAIEYEGAYHFGEGSVEQGRRDVARVRAMEGAGWKVFRATVFDLRDPREFVTLVRSAVVSRLSGVSG